LTASDSDSDFWPKIQTEETFLTFFPMGVLHFGRESAHAVSWHQSPKDVSFLWNDGLLRLSTRPVELFIDFISDVTFQSKPTLGKNRRVNAKNAPKTCITPKFQEQIIFPRAAKHHDTLLRLVSIFPHHIKN
jgi:hypothetical protein